MRPILLVLLGLCAACSGPLYTITVRNQSPLAAPCHVFVEPVRLDQLKIGDKTEAQWQATKKPDAQASWQQDKRAFDTIFRNQLAAQAGTVSASPIAGAYILRPTLEFYEPGFYAFIAAKRAETRMTIQLFDPSGTTLLEEAHATALGGNGFGSGETLRLHGQYLARHFAGYAAQNLAACRR